MTSAKPGQRRAAVCADAALIQGYICLDRGGHFTPPHFGVEMFLYL